MKKITFSALALSCAFAVASGYYASAIKDQFSSAVSVQKEKVYLLYSPEYSKKHGAAEAFVRRDGPGVPRHISGDPSYGHNYGSPDRVKYTHSAEGLLGQFHPNVVWSGNKSEVLFTRELINGEPAAWVPLPGGKSAREITVIKKEGPDPAINRMPQ